MISGSKRSRTAGLGRSILLVNELVATRLITSLCVMKRDCIMVASMKC